MEPVPDNAPVERVRLSWRRCETMIEHDGYSLSDVGSDASPRRARAKREWLRCVFTERRREQLQRLDMCIVHKLHIHTSLDR